MSKTDTSIQTGSAELRRNAGGAAVVYNDSSQAGH